MGETRDFAIVAAELEGDAVVGAGASRSTYAARMAPVPGPADLARQELARQFDHELDGILVELRATLHEAWASSEDVHSTMDLELLPTEGRWRVRLVRKRGGEEIREMAGQGTVGRR